MPLSWPNMHTRLNTYGSGGITFRVIGAEPSDRCMDGVFRPGQGVRQARTTSLTMISAATPSSTQPKTCLTARDFIRSTISREPS
jgi:hypothetical protein